MAKKEKDYSQIDSVLFNELVTILEEIRPKVHRFYNEGFKAPSTEIRLALKRLQNTAQDMRKEVSKIKNTPKNK